MGSLGKLGVAALAVGAMLLFGSRGRAQPGTRGPVRHVTRGLIVGDSLMAGGGAARVLREQTEAPWDNAAVVSANSAAVLQQAQENLRQQGRFSHVVVLAGVNDGDRPAAYTKTNLQRTYQLAKGMGAQVIAVTELPFRAYSRWTTVAQARQTELVIWLLQGEGRRYTDRAVDAWHLLEDPARRGQGYLDPRYEAVMQGGRPDGLHLNADGQTLLGGLILRAIRS